MTPLLQKGPIGSSWHFIQEVNRPRDGDNLAQNFIELPEEKEIGIEQCDTEEIRV